ncbi:MAG: hypothetical protein ACU837_12530 [Gammaproteobacteria bacterium]
MNTPALDLENKLVLPSKALYKALQTEFTALYQTAREHVISLHSEVAQATLKLYKHPSETLSVWKEHAARDAHVAVATFNDRVVPQLDASYRKTVALLDHGYRQMSADIGRLSTETRSFVETFSAHPAETSAQVYARVAADLQHAGQEIVQLSRQAGVEATADIKATLAALRQLYETGLAISQELIDAPAATAAAVYYRLTAALLDFYYQGVAVILETLHTAPMPSSWAL